MRKVSFNIPTYNRVSFLQKNLNILISQIIDNHLENDVEINISDNCSTDDTHRICSVLIEKHKDVCINYQCNDSNLGPDRNFLTAMKMAKGEYSLLWGDDDFLKERGLQRIFELIEHAEHHGVQILLSSTSVIDEKGKFLYEKQFLRSDVKEMYVDFSDEYQARSYFFLLKDMGGLLSFISDVIYKTSIIENIPYDEDYTGTHYAFLCYWWGWLAKGNKMYYSNKSFLNETIQYQPAYGFGVDREMVDYNAFTLIAKKSFKNSSMANDFLQVFQSLHPIMTTQSYMISEPRNFKERLYPKMIECGVESCVLNALYMSVSRKQLLKNLVYSILPESFIRLLKRKIY